MKPGRFISLEGGEGVGKTTNLEYIQHFLHDKHIPHIVTREPGGTLLAEKIRAILLDHQDEPLCESAELLLIFAARAQHIRQVIAPALQNGQWVLCDRFIDATYAYQGGGRQMDTHIIAWLEQTILGTLKPDLTLLLDAPADVGLKRAKRRGKLDRFETEQLEFFERVRTVYLQRAQQDTLRYQIIDACLPLQEVQIKIDQILERFLSI
ncbi:dTMP kinase [Methylomonas sp. AM2-LC]|uniref:dTMP kinase n=1 Tax=Methylomonas sp. AM2-LC TaxID=3153301 RepID=UPI003262D80B